MGLGSLQRLACGAGFVAALLPCACAGESSQTEGRKRKDLASDQAPWGLAVDGSSVYWTNMNLGTVMKVPKGGGDVVTLASGQQQPSEIVVDEANVYWINEASIDSLDGSLMKAPLDGGPPTTVASGAPMALAVDGGDLYWTAWTSTGSDSIMKLPSGSDQPTMLTSGLSVPDAMVLRDGTIYFSNFGDMTINEISTGGGPVTTLGSFGDYGVVEGFAVSQSDVYWTIGEDSTVQRVPIQGGSPVSITAEYRELDGIAIDDQNLYIASPATGSILRTSLQGGHVASIAPADSYPWRVAVDDTSVYWISDDKVSKASPK